MQGRFCRVVPLDPRQHAADLYTANSEDKERPNVSYLAYGPFSNVADYLAKMNEWLKEDWYVHATIAAFEAWMAPDNFDSKGRQRQSQTQLRRQVI